MPTARQDDQSGAVTESMNEDESVGKFLQLRPNNKAVFLQLTHMSDGPDPEQALREHLATVRPALEYNIRPMRIGIDGWRFFDAIPMEVNDATPSFFVVREDGTVLTGDPAATLEQVVRSMDLLEREEIPTAKLARAAAAMLSDGAYLVDKDAVERWSDSGHQDVDLHVPEVTATNGGLVLTFWVYTAGRGISFSEFEVSIYPDYQVAWDQRTR